MRRVIVRDVNETLLDVGALAPLFEQAFGDARAAGVVPNGPALLGTGNLFHAYSGKLILDVQSGQVEDGIESESLWLLCPELADTFEGRQASEALALSEVIRSEQRREVSA